MIRWWLKRRAVKETLYSPFRLGYVTAVDDIERTGLRPLTDRTKGEMADKAYRRLMGNDH